MPCQRHISPPRSEGIFTGLVLGMAGWPHDMEAQIVEQICTSPRIYHVLSHFLLFLSVEQPLDGPVEARALVDGILCGQNSLYGQKALASR